MDTRDFSVDTIEEIYDIIEELKNQGTFLDSMGDFWIRGEPDAVMLCTYAANGEMEEYYRKYADSMNLTKEKFGKIVENVRAVDKKYQEKFTDAKEEMQDFQEKLKNLAQEISMRTISLSEGQYRRAVEVLEGEDNQKKRQLETLIGVTRGSSGSSRMEEKIREILKYSVGNGNLEDELDVESTESGISQKRKMITKVEELKQQFKKGKITQDELISQICELYHVEDYGSKINYSLAVKKYQPEKKAAIVSDIFSTVLYIIGEDGIDAEKIEEIRQSVSAKSYIDDESWDMVEKAFRGVVVGVNVAVAADYYGNVGKVESDNGAVQEISNKFPSDNQGGREFNYTIENGRIHIENGVQNVDFIIDMDGNLHIGRGHSYLASGGSVQAAGTMKVNSQGYIRLITNESGHFQPTIAQAMNYPTVLKNAGLGVDNAWIKIGEFETSMSNYVIDSNVFYNGPIKNMP